MEWEGFAVTVLFNRGVDELEVKILSMDTVILLSSKIAKYY